KDEGKYDNTLLIYISDNGAAFPGAKTTLYEPGMNLPCIVRSPLHKKRGTFCDMIFLS
ncbi:heparan N-sulfatase, partial [Candidatus Poribacteria bacterium]|nr:heparan N-sulfatase [Candidatus Poribacteria bacterium]